VSTTSGWHMARTYRDIAKALGWRQRRDAIAEGRRCRAKTWGGTDPRAERRKWRAERERQVWRNENA
jgi:hypothetical protein